MDLMDRAEIVTDTMREAGAAMLRALTTPPEETVEAIYLAMQRHAPTLAERNLATIRRVDQGRGVQ